MITEQNPGQKTKLPKVALVDDEKNVRLAVGAALRKSGFEVSEFSNGRLALDSLEEGNVPDIYVLDIMMPVMDGITFLKNYKARFPEIPAIFLTSRDEEFDKVNGLESGADDYLCKPFSMKELAARIKVILRRYGVKSTENFTADSAANKNQKILENDNSISLDAQSCTATLGGKNLPLTVTEFRLLEVFMRRAGSVLTRDQLISAAYPDDTYLNDRAVDCHIKRLRKKIGADRIETVYGLGYKFVK